MTAFDDSERLIWAGRAGAYARSFAKLCAFPIGLLLDAGGVRAGTQVLDVGTGSGNVAVAACGRGAEVTATDAEPGMVELAAKAAPAAKVLGAVLPDLPFADDEFDAVVGNFVINHVGRARAALTELRRVTRTGGRIALTIWAMPPAAGQALIGQAIEAAGVPRPAYLPALPAEDDFPRTEQGFAELLGEAGLTGASCETLAWDHRATPAEWWGGAAAGVGFTGHLVTGQPPEVVAAIKGHFDLLSAEFAEPDGYLALPHAALLASGISP